MRGAKEFFRNEIYYIVEKSCVEKVLCDLCNVSAINNACKNFKKF